MHDDLREFDFGHSGMPDLDQADASFVFERSRPGTAASYERVFFREVLVTIVGWLPRAWPTWM